MGGFHQMLDVDFIIALVIISYYYHYHHHFHYGYHSQDTENM